MKILKLNKYEYSKGKFDYKIIVDKIPEITYEKIGSHYVGSAIYKRKIVFSNYLEYHHDRFAKAFAGNEITLKMKDGTEEKIKDKWWDKGSYPEHGHFMNIGINTIEGLQDCFVFYNCNINVTFFSFLLYDYYRREKDYSYEELKEWIDMQYDWYNVYIPNNPEIHLQVNKKGDFVDKFTKKKIYCTERIWKYKNHNNENKSFMIYKFKYSYINSEGRLIKIEKNLREIYYNSLPYSKKEINKICSLKE